MKQNSLPHAPYCPWAPLNRRSFLTRTFLPVISPLVKGLALQESGQIPKTPTAIGYCHTYDFTIVKSTLGRLFNLLEEVPFIVKGKHIVVKVNLVNTSKENLGGVPLSLTVTVHPVVALALASLFIEYGAKSITFCDQLPFREPDKEAFLGYGYNFEYFNQVTNGKVSFLNTRNKRPFSSYAIVKVPNGDLANCWEVNPIYSEADVLVSLSKLKEHISGGITGGMKNLFGIPPSSLYGDDLKNEPDENAIGYRSATMHECSKEPLTSVRSFTGKAIKGAHGINVPRFIVDLNAAFPVKITVLDAISTIQTGEGWWIGSSVTVTRPGLLIVGLNPVCTDAVATAIMGFDPDAPDYHWPFINGLNYLRLARLRGLGENRLKYLEVRGTSIEEARFEFHPTFRRTNLHPQ